MAYFLSFASFEAQVDYTVSQTFGYLRVLRCSDSIHCARKGLLQSAAAELYNPPRHPPLTLITAEDPPRFNPLALHTNKNVLINSEVLGYLKFGYLGPMLSK